MKIRVSRAEFADAAAWVASVINKNPQAAVLAGTRLTAADGTVTLSAYDYETAHTATLDADVLSDGDVVVSGRTLAQILAAQKASEVELTQDGNRLTISAGRATYRVGLMTVADFPTMPAFPTEVGRIGAAALAHAVSIVEHAASKDPTLNYIAVNLTTSQGVLALACTDIRRLARATVSMDIAAGLIANVPASVLTASLRGMTGDVTLAVTAGSAIGLDDGRRRVVSRLMADEFANVERALRGLKPTTTVEVEAEALAEAAKRALVLGDEVGGVWLDFADDEIAITADSESGDAAEYVEATLEGEPLRVRFNGRYLLDVLSACPSERVEFGMTTPSAVVRIMPVDDDRAAFVVMPRRTA